MKESFAPTWVFWVGLALALAGTYADYWKSRRQMAYGKTEATKWNRNKYRYLDPKKFWLWKAALVAPFCLLFAFTGEAAFGFGLWFVGALGFYITFKDLPKQRQNRQDQIADLTALSKVQTYDFPIVNTILNSNAEGDLKKEPIFVSGGRGRFEDFGWFYVDGLTDGDPQEAYKVAEKCAPHIWALSQKSPVDWFRDTTEREVK